MRWEKDKDYLEIEGAISVDEGAVWIVNTNLSIPGLPIEFRRVVPKTDDQGLKTLKRAVSNWVERNGFHRVDHSEDLDEDANDSDGDRTQ